MIFLRWLAAALCFAVALGLGMSAVAREAFVLPCTLFNAQHPGSSSCTFPAGDSLTPANTALRGLLFRNAGTIPEARLLTECDTRRRDSNTFLGFTQNSGGTGAGVLWCADQYVSAPTTSITGSASIGAGALSLTLTAVANSLSVDIDINSGVSVFVTLPDIRTDVNIANLGNLTVRPNTAALSLQSVAVSQNAALLSAVNAALTLGNAQQHGDALAQLSLASVLVATLAQQYRQSTLEAGRTESFRISSLFKEGLASQIRSSVLAAGEESVTLLSLQNAIATRLLSTSASAFVNQRSLLAETERIRADTNLTRRYTFDSARGVSTLAALAATRNSLLLSLVAVGGRSVAVTLDNGELVTLSRSAVALASTAVARLNEVNENLVDSIGDGQSASDSLVQIRDAVTPNQNLGRALRADGNLANTYLEVSLRGGGISVSGGAGEGFLNTLAYGAGGTATLSGLGVAITSSATLTLGYTPNVVLITATTRQFAGGVAIRTAVIATLTTSLPSRASSALTIVTAIAEDSSFTLSSLTIGLQEIALTNAAAADALVGALTPPLLGAGNPLTTLTTRLISALPTERRTKPPPLVLSLPFTGGCFGVKAAAVSFAGMICRENALAFSIDLGRFFTAVLVATIRFFTIALALLIATRLFLTGA